MKKCMLRTGRRIIQTAGYRINRSRIAICILKHDTVESMHNTFRTIGKTRCMISKCRTSSKGLYTINIYRVI